MLQLIQEHPVAVIAGGSLLTFTTVALLVSLVKRRDSSVPPQWSSGLPFIGGFLAFASDPLGTVEKARQAKGNTFSIKLLTETVNFLMGPEPHAVFFSATDEELDQADVYKFMTPIFGPGIVYDTTLDKRRQQMRALGAALKPANLRKYPELIASETHKYLESRWGSEGTVDIHQAFADLIIKTGSATLMGPEIRNELFDQMFKLYQDLDKGLTPLSVFFPYAPTAAHRRRDRARKEIGKLFGSIIAKRRADPEVSSLHGDIVQRMMDFRYTDGTALSDDEIAGMMVATLFAAQHTSNVTATWTTLFLLDNARNGGTLLQRALDEIASVEPSPGMFAQGMGLDHKVISDETWLYGCVKEAIRMHPPIIFLMRRALEDIELPYMPGTHIPKGQMVMVSNAAAQRLPQVFEDPNTYKPERWSSFDISKLPRYSFIGFGAGIHTCMGESFAFLQVRTILSVLFSKYELELTTPFPTPDYEAIVVMPHGPNLVRYKRRAQPHVVANVPASVSAPAPIIIEDRSDTIYTREQVAAHTSRTDLWIIVKGSVYDITQYVELHQGGANALLNVAGKDATEQVSGPQHPGTVWTLLERYKIGRVE